MNAAKIPLLVSLAARLSGCLHYPVGLASRWARRLLSLTPVITFCIGFCIVSALHTPTVFSAPNAAEFALPADGEDDVEIVIGEDKTIYEYRANGVLMIIKVVPKNGQPYYMVPADGSPHFTDLDHSNNLYPQWILLQW